MAETTIEWTEQDEKAAKDLMGIMEEFPGFDEFVWKMEIVVKIEFDQAIAAFLARRRAPMGQ